MLTTCLLKKIDTKAGVTQSNPLSLYWTEQIHGVNHEILHLILINVLLCITDLIKLQLLIMCSH